MRWGRRPAFLADKSGPQGARELSSAFPAHLFPADSPSALLGVGDGLGCRMDESQIRAKTRNRGHDWTVFRCPDGDALIACASVCNAAPWATRMMKPHPRCLSPHRRPGPPIHHRTCATTTASMCSVSQALHFDLQNLKEGASLHMSKDHTNSYLMDSILHCLLVIRPWYFTCFCSCLISSRRQPCTLIYVSSIFQSITR
jgi:hypothetical protein